MSFAAISNRLPSLRDLLGLCLLAKLLELTVATTVVVQGGQEDEATWLAAGISLLIMAGSLRLRGWSLPSPGVQGRRAIPNARWLPLALPLGLLLRSGSEALYLLIAAAASPAQVVEDFNTLATVTMTRPPWAFWPALLIGALEEEFFYRVVLLGWLATRWHWSIALLVSSAVFAVPHGNPVAFLGGLGLGLIYLQSRSLLAAFIAHVAANLVHPWLQWRGIAIDSDLTWQLAWLLAPAFIGFLVGSVLNLMRSRRASTP